MAPGGNIKLVLLGSPGVGKTQLVNSYSKRSVFSHESRSTIGVDFCTATVNDDTGTAIRVQLWDTAGQERFRTLQQQYYRGTCAVLMVFSLVDKSTFKALDGWYEDVCSSCRVAPTVMVVGNKIDLSESRACSSEEAAKWAAGIGAGYLETSAKTGAGVDDAFKELVITAYRTKCASAAMVEETAAMKIGVKDEIRPPHPNACCVV